MNCEKWKRYRPVFSILGPKLVLILYFWGDLKKRHSFAFFTSCFDVVSVDQDGCAYLDSLPLKQSRLLPYSADIVLRNKIVVYDLAGQRLGWTNYDCKLLSLRPKLRLSKNLIRMRSSIIFLLASWVFTS